MTNQISITQDHFIIDTADWVNQADAETAHDYLSDFISKLTQIEMNELRILFTDVDAENELRMAHNVASTIFKKLITAENKAFKKATKGYDLRNITGHNCAITLDYDILSGQF